ncbi:M48 family metalloprotease [Actinophytocola glycyrrhizae]|uniref:M48 family metalloprotease n=1 Tax=Actinophytocola glycyrrhizae TaxID=2044873 RepID=A0ABV9RRD7_9PSEU
MTGQAVHEGMAALVGRVGRLRGYAAGMFSGGVLLVMWRVVFMPAEVEPDWRWIPRSLLSVALNVCLLEMATRFLARAPAHSRWDLSAHVPALTRLSQLSGTATPRLIADNRSSAGARLRGWGDNTAIVVDSPTITRWSDSATIRDATLAHELGHLWAKDLHLYYRIRTISLFAIGILCVLVVAAGLQDGNLPQLLSTLVKIIVLGGLVVLSARSYIRFREHVADVSAMLMLDDMQTLRQAVVGVRDQTRLGRLIGTHPRMEDRLAVLFNFTLLMRATKATYLILGLSTGFAAAAVATFCTPLLVGVGVPHLDPLHIGVLASAVGCGILLATNLVEQWVFVDRSTRMTTVRLTSLFVGAATAMCVLDPFRDLATIRLNLNELALLTGTALLAAAVCALCCFAVAIRVANENFRLTHRAVLAGCMALCMVVVLELTHLFATR